MSDSVKRPAFQFYPGDWMSDKALRACSTPARGVWMDMLCLMHDSDPYGHLVLAGEPMDTETLARLIGESLAKTQKAVDELLKKGVARRTADGVLYSKRMVKDEEIRRVRAESGKLGGNPALTGKPPKPRRPNADEDKPVVEDLVKQPPNQIPTPSSSSSSSASQASVIPDARPAPDVTADVSASEIALRRRLPAPYWLDLDALLDSRPADARRSWCARLTAHADGQYAPHATPEQLGEAVREFVAKAPPSGGLKLFAGYVRGVVAPPRETGPPGAPGTPGTAVVPVARFPTHPSAAERLSERSRANTRIALDAIRAEREQRAGRSA